MADCRIERGKKSERSRKSTDDTKDGENSNDTKCIKKADPPIGIGY